MVFFLLFLDEVGFLWYNDRVNLKKGGELLRFTNITELIRSDGLESLLRMCGEKELCITSTASDYQFFSALCRSAPMLRGNPLVCRINRFLTVILQEPVSLSEDAAEYLWRESAAFFLEADGESVLRAWEIADSEDGEEKELDVCPRCSLSDFFDGNCLFYTSQRSWEAWRDEMKNTCEKAFEEDFEGVCVTLPKDFVFRSPHPYGVELLLRRKNEQDDARDLLLSQLFRFLSEECFQHGKTILCRVECRGSEAVRLFSYAESRVGLPTLTWSLSPSRDFSDLIAFSGACHQNPIASALQRSDYDTAMEFHAALREYAAVYPLGKLQILE